MNDMSNELLKQSGVEFSPDANKIIDTTEKTLWARSGGRIPERTMQVLKRFGQKPLVTAAVLLAIGNAGCNNIDQKNVPPPIPPPTATYELPTGMPSQTIEFTKTPMPPILEQQTPTPTPELSPRETVVQLKKEIQAESSKIMDTWEKDAKEIGYFFINIGGEKTPQGEDHRVFLLPIPIKDYYSVGPSDRNRYVLIASEGLKTFSPRPNEYPTSFDEEFNRNFFNSYYEYFQRSLTQSIIAAAESGTTPDNPFRITLSKQIESPSPLYPPGVKYPLSLELSPRDSITYTDFEGEKTLPTTSLYIPPINDKVKEVMEESKNMTKELTGLRIDREQRRLQDTKDLSNTLQSPSLPSPQPPTPTP